MQIKPEHAAAFAWAEAHFADGRTADDFAQEAIDAAGVNFEASRVADDTAAWLAKKPVYEAAKATATKADIEATVDAIKVARIAELEAARAASAEVASQSGSTPPVVDGGQ